MSLELKKLSSLMSLKKERSKVSLKLAQQKASLDSSITQFEPIAWKRTKVGESEITPTITNIIDDDSDYISLCSQSSFKVPTLKLNTSILTEAE